MITLLNARLRLTDCRLRLILDSRKWEEYRHKRNAKGEFMDMGRIGTVGTGKDAVEVQLGFPADKPKFYPETATKGHDRHHQKHADEMGITFKEWKRRAAALLNADASDDFLDWYDDEKSTFCRYEKTTQRIVFGTADGTINTYFQVDKHRLRWIMPIEYLNMLK